MKVIRSDDYRYTVDLDNTELTPLASVKAYMGTLELRVHNISQGGMAIIFDRESNAEVDDVIDVSVAVRERAFPVQVVVKARRGLRLSCAFINPPRAFHSALREFLKPKFLGQSLELNQAMSGRTDVLELVPAAQAYQVFLGQNQSGVFVWTGENRNLLKLVAVGQDLMFEWTQEAGLRTGRLKSGMPQASAQENVDEDGIQWHRAPEDAIIHYFADILLAWLPKEQAFVEALFADSTDSLLFPNLSQPTGS